MYSDNQLLFAEMRKAMLMIKETAVELERENEYEMLKELEDGVVGLGKTLDEFTIFPTPFDLLDEFQPAVENVHHEGQEQEDIVMTSTECNLLHVTCPLTGKPITELVEPVRSMDCKLIYEKMGIMRHIKTAAAHSRCPVADIDEMRSANRQRARADMVEDFTREDEEDLVDYHN